MTAGHSNLTVTGTEVGVHARVSRPAVRAASRLSIEQCGRRWVVRRLLRGLMLTYGVALSVVRRLARPRLSGRTGEDRTVLLTGTFYSDNWVLAHLRPLAASKRCSRVWIVSTYPVPPIPKVDVIHPPRWLHRMIGGVPSRLVTFVWCAVCRRPDIVGGFHLLVNGLVAAMVAPLVGARSMYFCVGGPTEILGGGVWAENRIFGKLETPDRVVEDLLIRAVGAFDYVITMGTGAKEFYQKKGIEARFHVVSGGIDPDRFARAASPPSTDLVFVGRLAQIKRVDLFLQAIRWVAKEVPTVTATIVGDGELRGPLEQMAGRLGVAARTTFAGHQRDIEDWLGRAKIFVLTSDSEGLSLSVMEAMMSGLPVVVSDVGDLSDLVEDGRNGYLIRDRTPEAFGAAIVSLLADDERRRRFAEAAARSAHRHTIDEVTRQWDRILAPGLMTSQTPDAACEPGLVTADSDDRRR